MGAITFRRVYFTCVDCDGGYPSDRRIGVEGSLSTQARRLVCLAGGQRSFENAEMLLKELCGWHVSDERIRQACHAEADRVAQKRGELPTGFTPSAGEFEFQTDATKINTDTGWRDMKIGIFAQRKAGESCGIEDWNQRKLPKPSPRLAFGAVEEIDVFAVRWDVWTKRLGLRTFERLSVIADGAEWIWNASAERWNASAERFPGHRGVLDIYHASEHLAATANVLFGDGERVVRQRDVGECNVVGRVASRVVG